MGKMGSACCKCVHPCGKYCVISSAISTTLTITGNHPAQLDLPIDYTVFNDPLLGNSNCAIEGQSLVNHAGSTGSLSVECREDKRVWYDAIAAKLEKCCEPNWVTIFNGSIESFLKSSARIEAFHKYISSRVRVRAGTKVIDGESVCGVYVNVCLIFARLLTSDGYSCGRTTVSGTLRSPTTIFDTTCCAESDEVLTVDETSEFASPDEETSGCDTSQSYDNADYLPVMPCREDYDPFEFYEPSNILKHQTSREVFIPNSDSIGCDPFVVTLTPDDIVLGDCGEVPGTIPSDPDPVFWVWNTCSYEDDDPRIPAPSLAESLCGSYSFAPSNFALFWDACDATGSSPPLNIILYVNLPSLCATDSTTLQGMLDNGQYKKTVTFRDRGAFVDSDIVDGEVMFDELSDTWTLTIESENCPPH